MISRYGVFCEVIESGSFTRAAENLGYSQSAVSQTVRAMERELGTTLVTRGKNGVALTADGEGYLPYIRAIHGAEAALEEKRREMAGLENSEIRIGTFTSVSRNLLPQLMQAFQVRYPGVHFVLRQEEYRGIGQWVREGSVDLGFINLLAAEDLCAEPLYRDEMVAVLPEGHPLAKKKTLSLGDIAGEPFILLDEGSHSVPLTAFEKKGLSPRVVYKVYDDYSILAMVRQGLGVALLYRLVVAGFEEGLAVRPIEEELERTVALAWKNWETLPLAARRFGSFIREQTPAVLADQPVKTGGRG